MKIIECLATESRNLIIKFINRIILNCAIMGKAPIYINNVWTNGKEYFIQFEYFEDVKKYIKPFIKMFKEENKKFEKEISKNDNI